MYIVRVLILVAFVPLLGAPDCVRSSNVALSKPVSGQSYCNASIPVQYDLELHRTGQGLHVVVGFYVFSEGAVYIVSKYSLPPGVYSGNSLSVSIPWSRVSAYRGKDVHVFVDVGDLSAVAAAGETVTDQEYENAVPLMHVHARATRSIAICPST